MYPMIPVFDDPSHPHINRMLKEQAKACPACHAGKNMLNLLVENCLLRPRYMVLCAGCKRLGPLGKDAADAIKKWNKPSGFLTDFTLFTSKKRLKRRQFLAHRRERYFP